MSGYMIMGMFDCPWFAKAGILIETLTKQDPTRKFNAEMLGHHEWQDFVEESQRTRGWKIKTSPAIWETLTDLEGKGNLIGDIDDFCEYINLVFGVVIHVSTYEIEQAVCKNRENFDRENRQRFTGNATILNIAIVQPPIKTLELLITQLLSPFPITDPSTILNIRIIDKKTPSRELQGFFMEVNDMASPMLYKISSCYTPKQCMYEAHLVLLMEDFLQEVGESYTEWMNRVETKVCSYAEAIDEEASTDCKILVGCNGPLCFIAETLRSKISNEKIGDGYIITIGQHVVNHGKTQLSKKADIPTGRISRLHAWGWPGLTGAWVEVKDAVALDIYGSIQGPLPIYRPLTELAKKSHWIIHEFSPIYLAIQQKSLKNAAKKMYSNMCIVEAIMSTLHVWFESTRIKVNEKNKCPNPCNPNMEDESLKEPTVTLPVLSVGIQCSKNSGFPPGTFIVQPAMCYADRWFPTGKISENTNQRINRELTKLWKIRQTIIGNKSLKSDADTDEFENFLKRGDQVKPEDDFDDDELLTEQERAQQFPDNEDYDPDQDQQYDNNDYYDNDNDGYDGSNNYYNTNDNGQTQTNYGQEEYYNNPKNQDYEEYEMFPSNQY